MLRVLALAAACSACAPVHRLAHPRERTPEWALGADFSLVCLGGAATAVAFNAGSPVFPVALVGYVGLILADTWAAR